MFGRFISKKKSKYSIVILTIVLMITAVILATFFGNTLKISHFTRTDMATIQKQMKSPNYQMANFNANTLGKTIPSAITYEQQGNSHQLVLWDSWPVTDQNGYLANYHGYHLTIALSAVDKRRDKKGVKMVVLAQKVGTKNQGVGSWTYLGPIFNQFTEGGKQSDVDLSRINNEWSGSAVLMNENDDSIRLFYTGAMTKYGQAQALTTAKVTIQASKQNDWSSGLIINHKLASDHKTVFAGDGKIYQKLSQIKTDKDSFAMRDPHFVVENGHYYLTFEANTGSNFKSNTELKNPANFGSLKDYLQERSNLNTTKQRSINQTTSVSVKEASTLANAAIGIIELNKDFTVKTVKQPLLVANVANDITERPNLFKYQGKWYLFTCFQGKSLPTAKKSFLNQNYLLGYVSNDGITGHYQKLNKTGLVLGSNIRRKTKQFTYAYLVVPSKKNGKTSFVITSFAGDRTFAPSIELKLNGKTSTVNNTSILNQGALTPSGQHFKSTPQKWA